MKKIALSALALAISAGSAVAADLPSRKAPILPPPPVLTWTGFYAGLNAGGLWSNNSSINNVAYGLYNAPGFTFGTGNLAALSATGNITGSSNSGFIGGGQIGYNWQVGNVGGLGFGSGFVTGIEADIQGIAGSTGQGNFFGAALGPAVVLLPRRSPILRSPSPGRARICPISARCAAVSASSPCQPCWSMARAVWPMAAPI